MQAAYPPAGTGTIAHRPWLDSYPPAARQWQAPGGWETLASDLLLSALRHPRRAALESWGVAMSYGQLRREAAKVTSYLQQVGLEPGARIAIMMPNVIPYGVVLMGAALGGYVVVNVNPLYTPHELRHQLEDAGVAALFVLEPFAGVVAQVREHLQIPQVVVVRFSQYLGIKGQVLRALARHVKRAFQVARIVGQVDFSEVLSAGSSRPALPVRVDPGAPAFLQYTGGTTGVSKGAVITHRNVVAHNRQIRLWCKDALDAHPVHSMVTALPVYHAVALMTCLIMTLSIGGRCILVADPRDIPRFVGLLRRRRFTMMAGVNTLYNALSRAPGIGGVDFSSCNFYGIGGAPTQASVNDRWRVLTGRNLTEAYGMSEATACITFNRIGAAGFSGNVGYPTPGTDVVIRDDDGHDLPQGEIGEICARGPQVMPGYWRRPAETQAMFWPDGFLRTGDLGWLQPDGALTVADRKKDMILVSGFNVFPAEIEGVIADHPDVVECAVVGRPDPETGEAVVAHIVRRSPALQADEMARHCHARLTRYKVPKTFVFTEALPKSNVGKILRRELRAASVA